MVGAVTVIVPRGSASIEASASLAWASSARMLRARGRNCSPASVSITRRELRWNRRVPISASSQSILRVTEDTATACDFATCEKLLDEATARKLLRASIMILMLRWMQRCFALGVIVLDFARQHNPA